MIITTATRTITRASRIYFSNETSVKTNTPYKRDITNNIDKISAASGMIIQDIDKMKLGQDTPSSFLLYETDKIDQLSKQSNITLPTQNFHDPPQL